MAPDTIPPELLEAIEQRVKSVWKATPGPAKVVGAGLVALALGVGTFVGYELGSRQRSRSSELEKRIYVSYDIEHAPYRNPEHVDKYVTADELVKLQQSPYYYNVKISPGQY